MTDTHSLNRRPPSPLRVFLADDDKEMRRMVASALRRDGHFVLEASDGAALLLDLGHVFIGEPPEPVNSVVISDVRMPGRDGLEILRRMREFPWCPPYILITAFGDPDLHEHARKLGARAVFDKPFPLDVLRALVLSIARAESGGDPPTPPAPPARDAAS
jgi:CheY-like chemotaxis protein